MSLKSFMGALSCCFLTAPVFAAPHVIVFGDSLSDAGMNIPQEDSGNNTWARSQGMTGSPITSLDPVTDTHPLWINWLLTKKFPGQTLYPIRIAQTRQQDVTTASISYAYSSAETGDHYLNDLSGKTPPPYEDAVCQQPGKISEGLACVPGVIKQVKMYLRDVRHPSPSDIYFIWAGGNDIFNNVTKITSLINSKKIAQLPGMIEDKIESTLFSDKPGANQNLFPDITHPAYNLLQAKNLLIEAGATPEQIYVMDLPDLSKTPAGIHIANGSSVMLGMLSQVSSAFNASLRMALVYNPFSKHNLPASHVLSSHAILNEIFDHPEQYSMTHLSESCVSDGKAPVCAGYFFYNDKHPTAKTGKILGEWVAEQMDAAQSDNNH